jgi:hypothetical protein
MPARTVNPPFPPGAQLTRARSNVEAASIPNFDAWLAGAAAAQAQGDAVAFGVPLAERAHFSSRDRRLSLSTRPSVWQCGQ